MSPSSAWWCLPCVVLAGCGGGAGVMMASDAATAADSPAESASDAANESATDAASDSARASGTTDAAGDDATIDGANDGASEAAGEGGVDPLAALRGCLGTSAPMTTSGQLAYATVPVGATAGAFLLDFATTYSSIDLKAFGATPPSTSGCDPSMLGVTCTVAGFAFFSMPSSVYLVTEDFSSIGGSVRQAGIIGTDFLSLKLMTLSWATKEVLAAGAGAGCDSGTLAGAGWSPLSTSGYYASDLSKLLPYSTVDSTASSGSVPNVPTVPVKIGGASAVAQLDTGFDDAVVRYSVNVNTAFYAAIVAADPGALVRAPSKDLSLSTCAGVSESVTAYSLGSGRSLQLVDRHGGVAKTYPNATVFVKNTPAAAHKCGGIGTWTAPAAQLGASFYVDMGSVIFDPFTSNVWVH